EARSERLSQQFEGDRRQQQPDLPAEPELSHHPPDMLREIDEDQWGELPDGLLRTAFAKAATGEAATDRKWERDDFSGDRSGDTNEDTDERTGVRSGDEAREQGAFERQIGGPIVEQQARGYTGHERDAECEREDQPIEPPTPLEDQNV